MKDGAGAEQQIVLVIVGEVREMGQVIVDLKDAQGETGTHRHVDPPAHAGALFMAMNSANLARKQQPGFRL